MIFLKTFNELNIVNFIIKYSAYTKKYKSLASRFPTFFTTTSSDFPYSKFSVIFHLSNNFDAVENLSPAVNV